MPTPEISPQFELNIERVFTRRLLGQPGPLQDRLSRCAWLKNYLIWERPSGGLVPYGRWTPRQKRRLDELFKLFELSEPNLGLLLPDLARNRALGFRPENLGMNTFLTAAEAFDAYAAHVAHSLFVEATGLVPWSLGAMTDLELADLFSSNRYHGRIIRRARPGYATYYPPHIRPDTDFQLTDWAAPSGSVLGDPRVGYRFLRGETSSRRTDLVASTPVETLVNLTRWCAQSVMHGGPRHDTEEYRTSHAFLIDRLRGETPALSPDDPLDRLAYSTKPVIPARAGCHGAINLMRDLARSVNLPLIAINTFGSPAGRPKPYHGGLLFVESGSWGATGRLRVLNHIDEVYAESLAPFFPVGPSRNPLKEAERWRAYFDALWLAPGTLANWGFRSPANYELGVRDHPADDRPTFGIDGGAWLDSDHWQAFRFERAMVLGSWSNFLTFKCADPFGGFGRLDGLWNLYHNGSSRPRATYRAMAETCIDQNRGCSELKKQFDLWRNRPTNVLRVP